ncbi:MAG: hypothetical protein HY886_02125 [Deltaproteobacteria bacterium]|nr:hypothetical protein [Deltaproteobacteria bacterium]
MKNHLTKNYLKATAVLFLFLSLYGCSGGAPSGGSSNSSGSASVGKDPGPEVSALYGVNETAGEFNAAVDSSGAVAITKVSGADANLAGTSSMSAGTLTIDFTISNASWSSLQNIKIKLVGLLSPITLSGSNAQTLGDVALYGSLSKSFTLNNVTGAFSFKVYITQEKEARPSRVIEPGGAPSQAASLFTISEGKKSLAKSAKALSGTVGQGASTSLKVDAAGNPKVSYMQLSSNDLKYAWWDGAAYQSITVDSVGSTGYYTSLGLTSLGNPRIAYYQSTDASGAYTGNLRYAYCNSSCDNAGSWGMIDVDTTGDVGGHTSIAVDNTDAANPKPRIAYYDFTNGNLKFAYCEASCNLAASWNIVTVDSAGVVGEYASLALQPSNNKPRISYYDRTNGDLKLAYCDAVWTTGGCDTAANWTIEVVDNSSSSDVGGYTSIAFNPVTGRAAISYYDFVNKDLLYAYSGDYTTITHNLGVATTLTNGKSAEVVKYLNGSSETRYRIYYSNGVIGFNSGYGWHTLRYQDTIDSNPPSTTNLGAISSIFDTTLSYGRAKPSVISLGGGKYRFYTGFMAQNGIWLIEYWDTNTTDGSLPSNANITLEYPSNGILAPKYPRGGYITHIHLWDFTQATGFPYTNNPEVIQFTNSSGQTRYRIYYNTYTNVRPAYIAYKETTDANPPFCENSSGSGAAAAPDTLFHPSNSNSGAAFTCTTAGNLGPEVNTGIAAKEFIGGTLIATLPDGKWRIYYPSAEDGLAYRDTTDVYPPTASNIGARQLFGITGYDPTMVRIESGADTGKYRLYYHTDNGSIPLGVLSDGSQIVYRDTTDTNLPTAAGGTSCCAWKIVRADSSRFACGAAASSTGCGVYWAGGYAWFANDRGAFSSLAFDVSGRPRISYYHRIGVTAPEGSECAGAEICNVSYEDTRGDLVIAQCNAADCTDQGNWTAQKVDTTDDTGWFTSMAVSTGGQIFTTYYDYNTTDMKIYTERSISTNLGSPQSLGIGTSTAINADSPEIVKMDSNRYRLYYNMSNGTYTDIAYKDTTDTNPPEALGTNLGAEALLGFGTSASDQAKNPEVIRLPDNTYRIYYNYTDGTIYYRDTYATDPPDTPYLVNNLVSQTSLGTGNWSSGTEALYIGGGKYRLYYHQSGSFYYKDTTTTDSSLPNSTNLTTDTWLGFTSYQDYWYYAIISMKIVRLPDNRYRLYYVYGNFTCCYTDRGRQLAYRDTSDTNPPSNTNLGAQVLLGVPSGAINSGNTVVGGPDILSIGGGNYRLYYADSSGQLAYNDTTSNDGSFPTCTSWNGTTCSANNLSARTQINVASYSVSLPRVVSLPTGKYRVFYTLSYNSTTPKLAYNDTTDTNPPSAANMTSFRYLYEGLNTSDRKTNPVVVPYSDSSKYRIYYEINQGGDSIGLYYKDTTDNNVPYAKYGPAYSLTGIGGTGGGLKVFAKPTSGYRLYFTRNLGTYNDISYADPSNASLPDASNLVSPTLVNMGIGTSTTNNAKDPEIIQIAGGLYRLYYSRQDGATPYSLAYQDTNNTSVPDATNLASRQWLTVGTASYSQYGPELFLETSGYYRLYYTDYYTTGGYGRLYYMRTTDTNPPTAN